MSQRDRRLLRSINDFQASKGRGPLNWLRRNWAKARIEVLATLSGSDIDRNARIHPSVRMPHLNGIVIHGDAVIEADCLIMQQVTIGQLASGPVPVIRRGAYIGAGAKVLGPVTVGENARIGANSVVLKDVPPNTTVVGIPARIVRQRE